MKIASGFRRDTSYACPPLVVPPFVILLDLSCCKLDISSLTPKSAFYALLKESMACSLQKLNLRLTLG